MIKKIRHRDTYPIRHQVMWPNESLSYIMIDGDQEADHYGYFIDDKLVSVVSVFIVGEKVQFRKFATLEAYQGQGIGSKLLAEIFLRYNSYESIWCNARTEKASFYEKFGMKQTHDTFIKGGKSYVIMKKVNRV